MEHTTTQAQVKFLFLPMSTVFMGKCSRPCSLMMGSAAVLGLPAGLEHIPGTFTLFTDCSNSLTSFFLNTLCNVGFLGFSYLEQRYAFSVARKSFGQNNPLLPYIDCRSTLQMAAQLVFLSVALTVQLEIWLPLQL